MNPNCYRLLSFLSTILAINAVALKVVIFDCSPITKLKLVHLKKLSMSTLTNHKLFSNWMHSFCGVASCKKFDPVRFNRFDVYWNQTYCKLMMIWSIMIWYLEANIMQGTISLADKTMVGSTNELWDKGRHYHVFRIKILKTYKFKFFEGLKNEQN